MVADDLPFTCNASLSRVPKLDLASGIAVTNTASFNSDRCFRGKVCWQQEKERKGTESDCSSRTEETKCTSLRIPASTGDDGSSSSVRSRPEVGFAFHGSDGRNDAGRPLVYGIGTCQLSVRPAISAQRSRKSNIIGGWASVLRPKFRIVGRWNSRSKRKSRVGRPRPRPCPYPQ